MDRKVAGLVLGCGLSLAAAGANGRVAGQAVPRVTAAEVLRLGGVDAPPEEAFSREPDLVVGPGGHIFARAGMDPFVTVFDRDGRFVRRIGREGDGPGEFETAGGHGLLGDTLWIRNWPTPRISTFLLDGTHVATVRTDVVRQPALSSPPGVTGYLQGGHAVAVPEGVPVGAVEPVVLPVLVGDRTLADSRPVVRVVVPDGMLVAGVGAFRYRPFPVPPLASVASDGSGLVVADWRDRSDGPLEIRRLDASGEEVWTRTLPSSRPRVAENVRDSVLAAGIAIAGELVDRARERGQVGAATEDLVADALQVPVYRPPVREVLAGVDGTVWLRRFDPGTNRWLVLDPHGAAMLEVALPDGLTVRQASATSIWATGSGAFDIPYIVRLELATAGPVDPAGAEDGDATESASVARL